MLLRCHFKHLLLIFQTCSDCSGANPAWVILLTLICGFLLVVTVVLLNLGASAPLDSLLFFLQVGILDRPFLVLYCIYKKNTHCMWVRLLFMNALDL